MIQINKQPGQRILELGGGANRNPSADVNVDARQVDGVDFVVDFESSDWPISSNEFDCVLAHFVLEHVSYKAVPNFLKESIRILKPGGQFICAVPNTEAQMKWALEHPEGWDGKDMFTSASEKLFGSQDYVQNAHKSFFSPAVAIDLFQRAGFCDIVTSPYGERQTDLAVQAVKPVPDRASIMEGTIPEKIGSIKVVETEPTVGSPGYTNFPYGAEHKREVNYDPAKTFDRRYFDVGGYYKEGYRDFWMNEMVFRQILARGPQSVLELGCGRGYLLKRLEDKGIPCTGLDISRHCWLTRACDRIHIIDVRAAWAAGSAFDLCFSFDVLDRIPEMDLPAVFENMEKICKRGLHAIDFHADPKNDPTRITNHERGWWAQRLPKGHVVVAKKELEEGVFPAEIAQGDGKCKLNIGCFTTMHHHGWTNVDVHDLGQWATHNGYNYLRHDVRNGLPHQTGTVDLIIENHFLEHLTYREATAHLKDCRRALRADGAMRIIVPDADKLIGRYIRDWNEDAESGTVDPYKDGPLSDFNQLSGGCDESPTEAGKLWALLCSGHQAMYDENTLLGMLKDAGFVPKRTAFRQAAFEPVKPILREAIDMLPEISLFIDAVPLVG